MRKFIDGYYRLLNLLLGASVGILIVPVTIQMISRFTALIPAWIWTEEMARFLFIWMVMLGAMIGVRDASHFECDVWPELKPRANALLRIVSTVFVLVFALVFVWYGIKFVQFGWNQTSELADLPMAWIFVAWPLTGVHVAAVRLRADPGRHPHRALRTWRRRRAAAPRCDAGQRGMSAAGHIGARGGRRGAGEHYRHRKGELDERIPAPHTELPPRRAPLIPRPSPAVLP